MKAVNKKYVKYCLILIAAFITLAATVVGVFNALTFPPNTTNLDCTAPNTDGKAWYNSTTEEIRACVGGVLVSVGVIVDEGIPLPTGGLFANLPTPTTVGQSYLITDAVDEVTCDAGGGDPAKFALCYWSGIDWRPNLFTTQQIFENSPDGGISHATEEMPEVFQPGKRSLGVNSTKIVRYNNAGVLTEECYYNNDPEQKCGPNPIFIPLSSVFEILYDDGLGGSVSWGTLTNNSGTITAAGQFQKPFVVEYVVTNAAAATNVTFYVATSNRTVTSVGCKTASTGTITTPPTFTLEDDNDNAMTITDTNPTCAAVGAAAAFKAVTAGNSLTTGESLRYNITNVPDGNDDFILIVTGTIP